MQERNTELSPLSLPMVPSISVLSTAGVTDLELRAGAGTRGCS